MQSYCESIKANVFKIIPLTFFVEIDLSKPNAMNTSLSSFIQIFNLFEDSKKFFMEYDKNKQFDNDFKIK